MPYPGPPVFFDHSVNRQFRCTKVRQSSADIAHAGNRSMPHRRDASDAGFDRPLPSLSTRFGSRITCRPSPTKCNAFVQRRKTLNSVPFSKTIHKSNILSLAFRHSMQTVAYT